MRAGGEESRDDVPTGSPVSPDEVCAWCGHSGFHHAFGPCDFSRGGERVDDCEKFVPSGMPAGSLHVDTHPTGRSQFDEGWHQGYADGRAQAFGEMQHTLDRGMRDVAKTKPKSTGVGSWGLSENLKVLPKKPPADSASPDTGETV